MASFTDVDDLASGSPPRRPARSAAPRPSSSRRMTPTLLFPFAAGRVAGDLNDAGSRAEIDTRILLWSVERLIGALAAHGRDHDIAARLHVVLPGSPNRGTFGGDGAYGEAKAALDAIVAKWRAERTWGERVTLVHAIIGWVRGTGLMGGNDPLVEAVEAAGVRTWTPDDMADALLETCTVEARESAAERPLTVDLTGGLADVGPRHEGPRGRRRAPRRRDDRDGTRRRGPGPVTGSAAGRRGARMGRGHGPSRGHGRHRRCRRARPVRVRPYPVRDGGRRGALRRRRPRAGLEHRTGDLGRERRAVGTTPRAATRSTSPRSTSATTTPSSSAVASAPTATTARCGTTPHRC